MKKIFVIFTLLGAMFAESQNGFLSEVGAGIGYYRYDEPQVMNTDDLLLNLNAKLGYRHHFIKTEGIGNVFVAFGRYNGAILELGEHGEGKENCVASPQVKFSMDRQKLVLICCFLAIRWIYLCKVVSVIGSSFTLAHHTTVSKAISMCPSNSRAKFAKAHRLLGHICSATSI